jgi:D-alanine-D-alanine ligase
MRQLHVVVLMGGPSAEREVSRQSGRAVVEALVASGARVTPVEVHDENFGLPRGTDVVFIALHGTFGEDGEVQRILESRGIAYTGSTPEVSARAFDKIAAKKAFRAAGIPTPAETDGSSLPVVVKPARQGSSVGIAIVRERTGFEPAIAEARRHGEVIIEQFIDGREFTVGILRGKPLPVVEIRTRHKFFDYAAKYTPGAAEEIAPAPIDSLLAARIQALALRAHDCLGCRDFSRVDLMQAGDGRLFVLEVNTIPGLTKNSLLPKAARAAGLSMQQLCVRIVEMAMTHARPSVTA